MFDPTIGRWISEDPIGFEAGDENLARYVKNASLDSTDPSGLQVGFFEETTSEVTYSKEFWYSIGYPKNKTNIDLRVRKTKLLSLDRSKWGHLKENDIVLGPEIQRGEDGFNPSVTKQEITQGTRTSVREIELTLTSIREVWIVREAIPDPMNMEAILCRLTLVDRIARVRTSKWSTFKLKKDQEGKHTTEKQEFFNVLTPFDTPNSIDDNNWFQLKNYPGIKILPGYHGAIPPQNFSIALSIGVKPGDNK
ncbi:RHS repeat-associated core domain-containing protein [Bremerella sp. JC770]|uniref:RHS repeat-associated core domain-containing protein n=1 Tax=Bremerella sp. JC770 TaxID=3232137 RepID=UPI003459ED75